MNGIVYWYRSLGIATKQFVFLFVVTFGMFIALAMSNLQDAEHLFREQVIKDSQQLIERTNQYVDSYLDNVQNMLLLLSTRSDLFEDGREKEAVKTLQNFANYNSSVTRTLYLIRKDGKVYSNTQAYYEILGNPHLDNLYRLAAANYGAMNVSEPYASPLSGRTIAYVLPVTDPATAELLGVVAAEIDLDRLTGRIAPLLVSENQTFTIITRKNNVITLSDPQDKLLQYEPGTFPPELKESFLEQLGDLPVGVRTIDGQKGSLVVVKSAANRLGWSLLSFIKEDYFYQNVLRLYDNYRNAGMVWLGVLLVGTLIMSRHFTKPVRTLVAKMDRVRDLGVLPFISIDRHDEIGRLAKSYNAMMERIHALIQETKEMEAKKKQYELSMLQSQIAPHFLYNTLACISSLARQRRIDDVRETIKSLVALLSFSFNRSSEFVTLGEELEGLKRYVHIQRVRYGDMFTLEIDVEDAALGCKMLKLTLQPLVENAIFHGIVPKREPGRIRIFGRIRGQTLRLFISDNGLGMDKSTVSRLLAERKETSRRNTFTGMGVMNVHERVRIHFGAAFGLKIRSRPGCGTWIRLKMPYDEWTGEPILPESP
ncbi:cache domain-containing sensor histidine kinase [Paenibacillus hamazuiensis]|uniref:cache domain-containing sensor histidine kinase n=1 Tax=Paenibacillus hamazuiensis TaxID=2936508 RepID=UPI00200C1493|nr:sensor histidine kinase [Paenibacillus hamazuiensis]